MLGFGVGDGVSAHGAQRDGAREEAREVVHLGGERAADAVGQLGDDFEVRVARGGDEVRLDTGEGFLPQGEVDGFRGLEVLFDEVFCWAVLVTRG